MEYSNKLLLKDSLNMPKYLRKNKDAENFKTKGDFESNKGEYLKSISLYDKAIILEPKFIEAINVISKHTHIYPHQIALATSGEIK